MVYHEQYAYSYATEPSIFLTLYVCFYMEARPIGITQ